MTLSARKASLKNMFCYYYVLFAYVVCLFLCFTFCLFFPGLGACEEQTVQHKLAELKTEICVGRAFVDSCLQLHAEHRLDSATASMAKYW